MSEMVAELTPKNVAVLARHGMHPEDSRLVERVLKVSLRVLLPMLNKAIPAGIGDDAKTQQRGECRE